MTTCTYPVGTVQDHMGRVLPIKIQITVDIRSTPMEVDTGASVSLIAEATYSQLWPGRSLSTTFIKLQTYSKEPITVLGTADVQVPYEDQTACVAFSSGEGERPYSA